MMAALVVGSGAGERVDPVILGMATVALDPVPLDPVAGGGVEQLLPQLGVLDGLLVGGPPAVALPIVDPPRDPVADIDAVGVEPDAAWALQGLETPDCGQELHSVVGGQRLAPKQLPFPGA